MDAAGTVIDLSMAEQEVWVTAPAKQGFWQTLSLFGIVPPEFVLILLGITALIGAVMGAVLARALASGAADRHRHDA